MTLQLVLFFCEAETEPVKLPRLSLVEARIVLFWWSDSSEFCKSYIGPTCCNEPKRIFWILSSLSWTFLWEKHEIWVSDHLDYAAFVFFYWHAKDVGLRSLVVQKMLGRPWQLIESLKGLRCWTFAFSGETLSKLCFHQICFHLRLQLVDPKRLLMPSQTKPGAAFPLRFISGTKGILKGFTLGLDEFVRLRLRLCRAYQFQVWFEQLTSLFTHTWNLNVSRPRYRWRNIERPELTEMTTERPKDLKSKCSCIHRATVWLLVRSDLLVKARKRADGTWDSGVWPWIFSVFLEVVINFEQKQLCETYERTVSRWLGFLQPSRRRCNLTGTQGLQLKHG